MLRRDAPVAAENAATRQFASEASPQHAGIAHESWVDAARLLAAFLIVLVHTINVNAVLLETPIQSRQWLSVDLLTSATRWALPIFIMISGYFLLEPRRQLDCRSYYARRMQRLAWPLLAWTVLYLTLVVYDAVLAGHTASAKALVHLVVSGMPYYHLWYLYMLPGLYLVAPFIKLATDQMRPGQLCAATVLCFAFTIFSAIMDGLYSVPNVTYIDDFPRYLGYFLAGHLLGRVWLPRVSLSTAALWISIMAVAVLTWIVATVVSPAKAVRMFGFGNPPIITMSLAAFVLLRRIPIAAFHRVWLARAGDATLGIYLVHPAILDALRRWGDPRLPPLAVQVMGVFIASLVIVLALQRLPALRRIV